MTVSRPARWAAAVDRAQQAMAAIDELLDAVTDALSDLDEIRCEYEEWLDNLPESLQDSATADLLNAVCDLDTSSYTGRVDVDSLSDVASLLEEADGIQLPRGFGRDS